MINKTVSKTLSPRFNEIENKVDNKMGKMRNALVGELTPLKGMKEEVTKPSQATSGLSKAVESNAS